MGVVLAKSQVIHTRLELGVYIPRSRGCVPLLWCCITGSCGVPNMSLADAKKKEAPPGALHGVRRAKVVVLRNSCISNRDLRVSSKSWPGEG